MGDRTEMYDVLMDVVCCVMCADMRVSDPEIRAICLILRELKVPWGRDEVEKRLKDFIQRAKSTGMACVTEQTVKRIETRDWTGQDDLLLDCIKRVVHSDGIVDPREIEILQRFKAALNTPRPGHHEPVGTGALASVRPLANGTVSTGELFRHTADRKLRQLHLAPDLQTWAALLEGPQGADLVINGVEVVTQEALQGVSIASGRQWACTICRDNRSRAFVNGEPVHMPGTAVPLEITVADDGHWACSAADGDRRLYVVDGRIITEGPYSELWCPVLGRDAQVFCVVKENDAYTLLRNGEPCTKPYRTISHVTVTKDNSWAVAGMKADNLWEVVVNGEVKFVVEYPEVGTPAIAPDGTYAFPYAREQTPSTSGRWYVYFSRWGSSSLGDYEDEATYIYDLRFAAPRCWGCLAYISSPISIHVQPGPALVLNGSHQIGAYPLVAWAPAPPSDVVLIAATEDHSIVCERHRWPNLAP